jgi:phosphopantothenoylcysteine decarboxylase/phosphopantothenate--cysteine ligase
VCAAAVADWRVDTVADEKIKKNRVKPSLNLIENPDVLASLAHHRRRPKIVVGFAAETDRLIEHAREKLARKGCDWILANDVSPESGVLGGAHNQVHLVTSVGVETWPTQSKEAVAIHLVARIAAALEAGGRA